MKKTLVRWKIYTDRARWYMQYIQMLIMIAILLQTSGIKLVWWHFPILLLSAISLFIVVGYVDVKLGLLKEEQSKYALENPIIIEILERLKNAQTTKA